MTLERTSKRIQLALWAGLIGLGATGIAQAQSYESGHGALQIWNAEAQANAPQWVQIWLMVMLVSFAAGLIFVWWRSEARWAVGGFIASIATAIAIDTYTETPLLSGLVALLHLVFWSPALYLLLTRRPFLKERSIYAVWSGLITFVICFSFIFDIRDAALYIDHILGLGMLS